MTSLNFSGQVPKSFSLNASWKHWIFKITLTYYDIVKHVTVFGPEMHPDRFVLACIVLVMHGLCSEAFSFPIPCLPRTLSQLSLSVPTLVLKLPKITSLSLVRVIQIIWSRSCKIVSLSEKIDSSIRNTILWTLHTYLSQSRLSHIYIKSNNRSPVGFYGLF